MKGMVLKNGILKNYHYWILIVLILSLCYLYSTWPWRVQNLDSLFNLPKIELENLALFEFRYNILGSLFIIPVIYSAIVFSWRGALITSSIAWVSSIFILDLWNYPFLISGTGIFLFLPVLIMSILTLELYWRRKQKQTLLNQGKERELFRQAYTFNILEAQESERKTIAQNLHDDTIQSLLTIVNQAELLKIDANLNEKKADVIEKAEMIELTTLRTIDDLRRLCSNLRPSILDDLGLVAALRWLVANLDKECNINTQIFIKGIEQKLPSQYEVTIFRVSQEALNNIRRHSQATEATIELVYTADHLTAKIRDNGQGFIMPQGKEYFEYKNKMGLIGINQRIKSLGGTVYINTKVGQGTSIEIELDINNYHQLPSINETIVKAGK